jgi:hypothetical protein
MSEGLHCRETPILVAGESTLHVADALTFPAPCVRTWDVAWHDLWTEEGCDSPGLHVLHAQLLMRFRHACPQQGAWAFPREFKRLWPFPLLGA